MDETREHDFDGSPKSDPGDFLDLPPEFCEYRDEGCSLSNSCLGCPFPRCMHEIKGASQKWLRQVRDREMACLFISGAKQVPELAAIFGVSKRTVERAVRAVRPPALLVRDGRRARYQAAPEDQGSAADVNPPTGREGRPRRRRRRTGDAKRP